MQTLIQSVKTWFAVGSPARREVAEIYTQAVERGRQPAWYADAGVPDTLDGRFEVIIVELFLLMRALKSAALHTEQRQHFEQVLLEQFVADMDRNLREIGVADMGMHYKMKHISNALYGRLRAYHHAWEERDDREDALRRNVFGPEHVPSLAQYQQFDALLNAEESFWLKEVGTLVPMITQQF